MKILSILILAALLITEAVNCDPFLGQPKLEFSGVRAHIGGYAEEPFISDIGGLLPMALCGRISL